MPKRVYRLLIVLFLVLTSVSFLVAGLHLCENDDLKHIAYPLLGLGVIVVLASCKRVLSSPNIPTL